ncbi:MAG: amidase [Oligoflexia bacterium]|nr:amidase [Oligoflexia bacterium]MBF0365026.1 amidase [Oligoflexia bacterium]
MELFEYTATELAKMIVKREVSSEEIVCCFLKQIELVNPHLNAAVQIFAEEAVMAAKKADSVRHPTTPLHGVPFTAKDVFEVEGKISAAGIMERKDFRPAETAVAVQRLLDAGAILLAKSNCPPGGAGGESDNPVYGRTLNPFLPSRTPGGSSGGEAALVSARASSLGLGSDSGGSLRFPAHCCGVYSFKPTTGRVPNTGAYEHPGGLTDPRTQIGAMARSVEDLELAYGILAGPDPRDSGTFPVPVTSSASAAKRLRESGKGLKILYFGSDNDLSPTAETVVAVKRVAELLRHLPYTESLSEGAPPYCPKKSLDVSQRYWQSSDLSGLDRDKLLTDWDVFRASLALEFKKWDVVVGPVCATPAPEHGTVDAVTFQYTLAYSLLGCPCLVVPAGMSSEGLPIGVQLAAAPWNEDILLAIGLMLQRELGPGPRPLRLLNT